MSAMTFGNFSVAFGAVRHVADEREGESPVAVGIGARSRLRKKRACKGGAGKCGRDDVIRRFHGSSYGARKWRLLKEEDSQRM